MTRKQSGGLFLVIALVMFTGPQWAPMLSGLEGDVSRATFARMMAVLYFMPGIAVIFLLLGIYRLASKDESQPPG